MCHHCGGGGQPVDVTEENRPYMVQETTLVALHAASAFRNGWTRGAQGLYRDMLEKWGEPGDARINYVWGSARYFLPEGDPDRTPPLAPGHSLLAELSREMTGEEPDPQVLSRLVALNDQVGACVNAITSAASRGDVAEVGKVLTDVDDQMSMSVSLFLMADAGNRMQHAKSAGESIPRDLFNAHVRAGFPPPDEEETEGGAQ